MREKNSIDSIVQRLLPQSRLLRRCCSQEVPEAPELRGRVHEDDILEGSKSLPGRNLFSGWQVSGLCVQLRMPHECEKRKWLGTELSEVQ